MLRLNRIALIFGALLAPFAGSGLVILVAGWIETIAGYDFADKSVAVLSVLVSIGAAIAAFITIPAMWDET